MKVKIIFFFIVISVFICANLFALDQKYIGNKIYILDENKYGEAKAYFILTPDNEVRGTLCKVFQLECNKGDWGNIKFRRRIVQDAVHIEVNDAKFDIFFNTNKWSNMKSFIYDSDKNIVGIATTPINSLFYVIGDDALTVLKGKKQNEILKNKRQRESIMALLPVNYNKGRFGGGYQFLKWGMSESESRNVMKKNNWEFYNKKDEETYRYFPKSGGNITAICLKYYNDFLYDIEVFFNFKKISESEIHNILTKKYKRSRTEFSEIRRGEFIRYSPCTWRETGYLWTDGITEIRHSKTRVIINAGNCPANDFSVNYRSRIIFNLKTKLDKQRKWKQNKNLF